MDDTPIQLRCEIVAPDDLIVLDPTLLAAIDITTGLKPGGSILINSPLEPEEYAHLGPYRIATVDANTVAQGHGLGSRTQPIVNTAIVGAYATFSGVVSLDAVCEAIAEEVPVHFDANVAAAREAAGQVRILQEAVNV